MYDGSKVHPAGRDDDAVVVERGKNHLSPCAASSIADDTEGVCWLELSGVGWAGVEVEDGAV